MAEHAEGFVVNVIATTEFDAQVAVYTRQFGLKRLLVRSIRKPLGKLKSILTGYNQIDFSFVSKGEGQLLTTAYLLHDYYVVTFRQSLAFWYACQLIVATQPEEVADEQVYQLIQTTFTVLEKATVTRELVPVVMNFERLILSQGGFIDESVRNIASVTAVQSLLRPTDIFSLRSLLL